MAYENQFIKFIEFTLGSMENFLSYLYLLWNKAELLDQVLLGELSLIIVGTIAVFFYKSVRRIRRTRVNAIRKYLYQFLSKCYDENILLWPNGLPDNWHTLEFLIPVMEKLSQKYKRDQIKWPQISDTIFESILLPIARREVSSRSWLRRHWALRCFRYTPRHRDLKYMLKFLDDTVPHNRFAIVGTLMSVADKNVIVQILQVMATESRHSRGLYSVAFKHLNPKIFKYVRDYLHEVHDVTLRRVCWDVLEQSPELTDFNEALKDIRRSNVSLRMSALRFLAKFEMNRIRHLIFELLDDKEWELRSLSAKIIGDKKDKQGLFKLRAKLKDPKWWVRMNSALALQNMGETGIKILKQVRAKDDRFAYETVRYVLILSDLKAGKIISDNNRVDKMNNMKATLKSA